MEVFVVFPSLRFSPFPVQDNATVRDLIRLFTPGEGISDVDFYIKKNGRISGGDERLQPGAVYRIEPRLRGGKGGFGSMLRALGAQIEKTTNREACRDLSGRRLRDVNHEKEMAEWLKKQADRDAEKEQRRLERIQRKLAEPKHRFTDAEYERQCHDLSERLEDSVLKGMQASSSSMVQPDDKVPRKRLAKKIECTSSKKKCFWTGLEDLEDMDSSDAESDESESKASSSSSSSSSCSGAGPSCSFQPARVPPTATTEQQKDESQDRPCSSSSSSANSASCSPHPAEEKEERAEEMEERAGEKEERAEEMEERAGEKEERAGEKEERAGEKEERAGEKEERAEEMEERAGEKEERAEEMEERAGEKEERAEEMEERAGEKEERAGEKEERVVKADTKQNVRDNPEVEKDKIIEKVDAQPAQAGEADALLDLLSVSGVEELEALGLERLKVQLTKRGMKCGGTLQERAARLYSVKGLSADQIDPALLAKPSKGKKK
ncbi:replication stress response regulator SDE2 isoform X1 [Silurus meridionalis]|uniref:Replication stress response regulator SDE2 n=1 Tax=Silurus meridionalis TaxID=175797 RepID=A0A8T0ACP2_SILME|nr:replication stress response regulator SDE2 isoform X1 [Silurus meridionalis]KAF7688282.1 hypothetical protein HF521_014288 [Silurus meridionalis]